MKLRGFRLSRQLGIHYLRFFSSKRQATLPNLETSQVAQSHEPGAVSLVFLKVQTSCLQFDEKNSSTVLLQAQNRRYNHAP